jgi:hypothetical protein
LGELSRGETLRHGEKVIGDALHGRNYHRDAGNLCFSTDETRSVQHAFGAEQRATAKFEGHDIPALFVYSATVLHSSVQHNGASFGFLFFLYVFKAHDLRSWFQLPSATPTLPELTRWSVSGGGLKEETHRQVRFWRWVGNFLLVC